MKKYFAWLYFFLFLSLRSQEFDDQANIRFNDDNLRISSDPLTETKLFNFCIDNPCSIINVMGHRVGASRRFDRVTIYFDKVFEQIPQFTCYMYGIFHKAHSDIKLQIEWENLSTSKVDILVYTWNENAIDYVQLQYIATLNDQIIITSFNVPNLQPDVEKRIQLPRQLQANYLVFLNIVMLEAQTQIQFEILEKGENYLIIDITGKWEEIVYLTFSVIVFEVVDNKTENNYLTRIVETNYDLMFMFENTNEEVLEGYRLGFVSDVNIQRTSDEIYQILFSLDTISLTQNGTWNFGTIIDQEMFNTFQQNPNDYQQFPLYLNFNIQHTNQFKSDNQLPFRGIQLYNKTIILSYITWCEGELFKPYYFLQKDLLQDTCKCIYSYYYDVHSQICKSKKNITQCPYQCDTCYYDYQNNRLNCLSCDRESKRYLDEITIEDIIISECLCQKGYVDIAGEKTCQCINLTQQIIFYIFLACSNRCNSCVNSPQECTDCNQRFSFFNQNVSLELQKCFCLSNFYEDENRDCQGICDKLQQIILLFIKDCHLLCDSCFGPSFDQCYTCKEENNSILSTTVDYLCECKIGYYQDENDCVKCHPPCRTCYDSTESSCLSCWNDRELNLVNNYTICVCLPGTYDLMDGSNQCLRNKNPYIQLYFFIKYTKACHYSCNTCKNPEVCESCSMNSHYRIMDNNSLCQCIEGYYDEGYTICKSKSQSKTCNLFYLLECYYACKSCTGGNAQDCILCESLHQRHKNDETGECQCNLGYIETGYEHCGIANCHYSCHKCLGEQFNQCLECNNTRQLEQQQTCNCVNKKYNVDEYSECKWIITNLIQHVIIRATIVMVHQKHSVINVLLIKIDFCLRVNVYVILDTLKQVKKIAKVNSVNNIQIFIQVCNNNCQTCIGKADICETCKAQRKLVNQKCTCPSNTYDNELTGECLECDKFCMECTSSNNCTSCGDVKVTHRTMYLGICLCAQGYYPYNETCLRCPKFCQSCSNENKCDSCLNLRQGDLCEQCPQSYYIDEQGCKECDPRCKQCFGPFKNQCIECSSNRTMKNGQCYCNQNQESICVIDDCLPPLFTYESECFPCNSICLTCHELQPYNCIECVENNIAIELKFDKQLPLTHIRGHPLILLVNIYVYYCKNGIIQQLTQDKLDQNGLTIEINTQEKVEYNNNNWIINYQVIDTTQLGWKNIELVGQLVNYTSEDDRIIVSEGKGQTGFLIQQGNIRIVILQGDRIIGVGEDLIINANIYNDEIQEGDEQPNYQIEWECRHLDQLNCDNIVYNPIELPLNIQPNTFLPYRSYQFFLTVTYQEQIVTESVTIEVIERNMPSFSINYDLSSHQIININQELRITMNYEQQNKSGLVYYGKVYQGFQELTTIFFPYYDAEITLWDHLDINQLPTTQTFKLKLMLHVFDPSYYIPTRSSINLNINHPPQGCVVYIDPLQGTELQTNFTIQLQDCIDDHQNLQYQYAIIDTQSNYNWLGGYSFNMKLDSILLPYPGQLLLTVKDSLGGIWNTTFNDIEIIKSSNVQVQSIGEIKTIQKNEDLIELQTITNKLVKVNGGSEKKLNLVNELIDSLQKNDQDLINQEIILDCLNRLIQDPTFKTDTSTVKQVITSVNDLITKKMQTQDKVNFYQISKQMQQLMSNSILKVNNMFLSALDQVDNYNGINEQIITTINEIQSYQLKHLLPNQLSQIIFPKLKSGIIMATNKRMTEYVGRNPFILEIEEETTEEQQQEELGENGEQQEIMYIIRHVIYEDVSPYSTEQNFPYPQNNNILQTMQIYSTLDMNISLQPRRNITFKMQRNDENKSNYVQPTCLNKNVHLNNWSPEQCQINTKTNSCECSELSPVTLIDDVDNIFGNLEKHFTDGNPLEIKSTDFISTSFFYLCCTVVALGLMLIIYGIYKDKLDHERSNKIVPESPQTDRGISQFTLKAEQFNTVFFKK